MYRPPSHLPLHLPYHRIDYHCLTILLCSWFAPSLSQSHRLTLPEADKRKWAEDSAEEMRVVFRHVRRAWCRQMTSEKHSWLSEVPAPRTVRKWPAVAIAVAVIVMRSCLPPHAWPLKHTMRAGGEAKGGRWRTQGGG
eukprot:989182-Pyramimonas_sp.AAC.1